MGLLSGEHPSKRCAVLEHMTLALQPILEKGIVDHSIVHRALLEYMCIENESLVTYNLAAIWVTSCTNDPYKRRFKVWRTLYYT